MKKSFLHAAVLWALFAFLSGCGSSGDQYPPTVPSGVQAAAVSSDSVQLNWTASQDDLLMFGYRVYRDGSRVGSTPLTTYTDTGLSPGNTYGYRVSAYDWIGNESEKSTTLFVATADGSAPTAPANLQGTAVSTSRIDLAWTASTDNVGVTGYRIYRDGAVIGTTAGTSFSDTGLAEYTTYVYRVAACDAGGNESTPSSPLTATTVDATAPSVPSNLQGTGASASQIDLTWTASTDNVGVAGYRVYRDGSLVASPAGTTYSDTGLAAGTTYGYRVAAYDAAGNTSAQCAVVSATTQSGTWSGTVLIGTASTDRGHGIAVDTSGNIYVAGYTAGNLDGETNNGGDDIFLTKYDSSGARQWTRLSGTAVADASGWSAVAVDGSGNIYVTGYTSGNLDGETNGGAPTPH